MNGEPAREWPAWRAEAFWLAAGLVLLAAAFLPVAGAWNAPFSYLDDENLVLHNPLYAPETGLFAPFLRPHNTEYAPLTQFSFRLTFEIFGREAPWAFRMGNWLLHGLSAILLAAVLLRLGLARIEALFVAAAWAAHPLAGESVAWIIHRNNGVVACCGLAGLWAALRWHGEWRGLLLGLLGAALACLGKPAGVAWCAVFVSLELLGGPERLRFDRETCRRQLGAAGAYAGAGARVLPFLVLGAACTLLALTAAKIRGIPPPGGTVFTAALTDAEIFARYLGNLLAPLKLSQIYGVEDIRSLAEPRFWSHAALLAAAVGLTLALARHRVRALFGWLWFFGMLLPYANFVSYSFTMQDRYVYLPMIGALLVLLETAAGILARARRLLNRADPAAGPGAAALLLGGAWVLALGGLALQRSRLWADPAALMAQSVLNQPRSGLVRIQFATTLRRKSFELLKAEDKPFFVAVQGADPWDGPSPFQPRDGLPLDLLLWQEIYLQFERALQCPDAYRYFDPLRVRVFLAKGANDLTDTGLFGDLNPRVRWALEGLTPPPAPPGGELDGVPPVLAKAGFRRMRLNGIDYYYNLDMLAQACLALSETTLREAWILDADPAARAQAVAETMARVEQARAADPRLSDAWYLQAGAELALVNLAERRGDLVEAQARFLNVLEALKKVGQDSPRYAQAQRKLRELKAPRPRPPPRPSRAPNRPPTRTRPRRPTPPSAPARSAGVPAGSRGRPARASSGSSRTASIHPVVPRVSEAAPCQRSRPAPFVAPASSPARVGVPPARLFVLPYREHPARRATGRRSRPVPHALRAAKSAVCSSLSVPVASIPPRLTTTTNRPSFRSTETVSMGRASGNSGILLGLLHRLRPNPWAKGQRGQEGLGASPHSFRGSDSFLAFSVSWAATHNINSIRTTMLMHISIPTPTSVKVEFFAYQSFSNVLGAQPTCSSTSSVESLVLSSSFNLGDRSPESSTICPSSMYTSLLRVRYVLGHPNFSIRKYRPFGIRLSRLTLGGSCTRLPIANRTDSGASLKCEVGIRFTPRTSAAVMCSNMMVASRMRILGFIPSCPQGSQSGSCPAFNCLSARAATSLHTPCCLPDGVITALPA
ncbi:MAG: hypothetical protein M5U26_29820 [Planctomycetota bacterium]|nr:hypothetical protein [Planctomycetota bacterium]